MASDRRMLARNSSMSWPSITPTYVNPRSSKSMPGHDGGLDAVLELGAHGGQAARRSPGSLESLRSRSRLKR